MTPSDPHRAVEAVWRIEAARLIAGLARLTGDLGQAEDLAQDAFVAALEHWPRTGIPERPGAWLMATAKRRGIDALRRRRRFQAREGAVAREMEAARRAAPDPDAALDDPVGDDVLRLIFMACHPVLAAEARVALTLRLVGGLTTAEIARACLVPEATLAQRIVRAKRTLARRQVPFELPAAADLAPRLESVLEVVYLIFNEGYAATGGEQWTRPQLCEEALRLGRMLAHLAPDAPEVHGLVALMEIQASRLPARVGADGSPVRLADQDRSRWDPLLIRRGLAALERAERLGGGGAYVLQASIAACHARARTIEDTDWRRITFLYGVLARVTPSPVVELNRAVAMSMADGAGAALAHLDGIDADPAMQRYHLYHAVRGDLLERLGRPAEARAAFDRAADLTANAGERSLLQARAARCGASAPRTG